MSRQSDPKLRHHDNLDGSGGHFVNDYAIPIPVHELATTEQAGPVSDWSRCR